MENKIAIIDPVGIKSGMNHYDTFLCSSLTKLGVKTFIFSNFTLKTELIYTRTFFGVFFENKFFQTFNFLLGMVKSCIHCKKLLAHLLDLHLHS